MNTILSKSLLRADPCRYSTKLLFHTSSTCGLIDKIFNKLEDTRKQYYKESKEEHIQREKDLWREYQKDIAKYSSNKREAMKRAQIVKDEEARIKQEMQEEAVRKELQKRFEKGPKDNLGEEYFKDYSRFDKLNDQRDPLFHGVEDKGSDDWRQILRERVDETKENFEKMKESQPFTYHGAHTEAGKFGYQTVSVQNFVLYAILGIAALLMISEFRASYYQNKLETDAFKSQK